MPSKMFRKTLLRYTELDSFIKKDLKSAEGAVNIDIVPIDDENGMIPVKAYALIKIMAELFVLGQSIGIIVGDPQKSKKVKMFAENSGKPPYPVRKKVINDLIKEVSRRIKFDNLKKALSFEPPIAKFEGFDVVVAPIGVLAVLFMASSAYLSILSIGRPPMILS